MVAWLNGLLAPLKWLHTQFIIWSDGVRYDTRITGQVRSLEYHLNRLFTGGNTTIYIEDAATSETLFIYLESENHPIFLPKFISGSEADFLVYVPNASAVQVNIIQIRAFLDNYKLPSKRYQIIGYGPFD